MTTVANRHGEYGSLLSPIAECKQGPLARVFAQALLHQGMQAVKTFAHVARFQRHQHFQVARKLNMTWPALAPAQRQGPPVFYRLLPPAHHRADVAPSPPPTSRPHYSVGFRAALLSPLVRPSGKGLIFDARQSCKLCPAQPASLKLVQQVLRTRPLSSVFKIAPSDFCIVFIVLCYDIYAS
jgi:hypothetical protein